MGFAVLLACAVGAQYGVWITGLCLGLLVALLGALKGIQYSLGHVGVRRLAHECEQYRISRLISGLKAHEKPGTAFTFVVLGDTRGARDVPLEIHEQVKKESPVFIVNTGDLVRFGTAREYVARYLPILEIMEPIPVLSVPGNHDRGPRNDFAGYRAVCGGERFSFDYGPCRFIGVNNGKRPRMEADDIEFLRQELSKSPVQFKFVFIHIPPRYFEDGVITTAKRRGFRKFQQEFRALMTDQCVTEVFMGHIHGYATQEIDGVRYTLSAGAGAPLCKQLPAEARVHHYIAIRVDCGQFEREVIRSIDGQWRRGI